jgi:single-strand DNA-binding protein
MNDVDVTVVGHVGAKPELYQASSGVRWTSVRVASTRRLRDSNDTWTDGPTMWFTVRVFGDKAKNVVDSLDKGTPVVVKGRLAVDEYEARTREAGPDGEFVEVAKQRWSQVVENATIGVDCTRGVVRFTRIVHTDQIPSGAPASFGVAERPDWNAPGAGVDAELADMLDEAAETAAV